MLHAGWARLYDVTTKRAVTMSDSNPIQFIDSARALVQLCDDLASASWLAIDTEFLRERTYRPELALIQIAAGDTIACIDPLALDSLEPLLELLYRPDVTKVLHAAGQDLEIFYWLCGKVPENLFDTQIAAPLLGYQEQLGYGNLVREVLGVELTKSHARADWMRRPLPSKQLQYAADDVIYLARMYPIMRERLNELGRSDWLAAEWIDLADPQRYEKPADQMWKRLKQINNLKGARLSIAQQLAAWREITARQSNLPRNWLLKDALILDLARQMPDELAELKHIRGLSDGTIRHHGKAIIAVISRAKTEPPQPNKTTPRKGALNIEQEAACDVLEAVAKLHADQLAINATVLTPRKALEALIRGNQESPLMQGWRRELIGMPLQQVLAGEVDIQIENGRLKLRS